MPATISELLDNGMLNEAIAALGNEIRRKPTDVALRSHLAELLCIRGDLQRADTILDSVVELDPSLSVGVALKRQLIRAALARTQFYMEGRVPEFLTPPDRDLELTLRASVHSREGDQAESARLLAERDAAHIPLTAFVDGVSCQEFRDLDDLCAHHLEVMTAEGRYCCVSFGAIASIQMLRRERRWDFLWPRVRLTLNDGTTGEVYCPATYFSERDGELEDHKLGFSTDFVGDAAPIRGRGLRMFMCGDDPRSLFEFRLIQFRDVDHG